MDRCAGAMRAARAARSPPLAALWSALEGGAAARGWRSASSGKSRARRFWRLPRLRISVQSGADREPPLLQSMRQLVLIRDIDAEISVVASGLVRIPEEREAIERELGAAREAIAKAKVLLEEQQVEERRLEAKMREQEALLQRLSAQTAQVTSAQAYQALQHELEQAGAASSEFETRALELMESIDQVRGELAAARDRLQRAEEQAPDRLAELSAREKRLTAEREALAERREKACQCLDASLLAHYERIAQQRRPAVGIFAGKVCPECGIAVPTMRASEIQRAQKVHTCSGCRRLLVPVQALGE